MLVTVLKGVRIAYCCQVKKSETVSLHHQLENSFVLYFSVHHLIHTAIWLYELNDGLRNKVQKERNATSLKC